MNKYYSQCWEDEWIDQHLNLSKQGVFVDLGCAYPAFLSNTAFLRDKGWTGAVLDANPIYIPEWSRIGWRMTNAILSNTSKTQFNYHREPTWSHISNEGPILPAITINQFLEDNNISQIDLLSVDLEGAEYDVMRTLDWDKYKPAIIISEYETVGKLDYRLSEYLDNKGYRMVHQTRYNFIHVIQ